ncbi:hypothetical protein Bpfe_030511, partial [Biomphalaria pfeifferi]
MNGKVVSLCVSMEMAPSVSAELDCRVSLWNWNSVCFRRAKLQGVHDASPSGCVYGYLDKHFKVSRQNPECLCGVRLQ